MVGLDFSQKQHERFILPVYALLKKAFTELGYQQPEKETEVILMLVDALWKLQVSKQTKNSADIADFVKTKYSLKP